MAGLTAFDLKAAASRIATGAEAAAAMLNTQDGLLGDGDLGVTVARGWQAVASAGETFPDDIGKSFMACAKAFQQVSSSSFGTLVATAFIAVAKKTSGAVEIPLAAVPELLATAGEAMAARGKGAIGDKTVLDSLAAVVGAIRNCADPAAMASAADAAARAALDEYRDKPSRLGRARMFAERSAGLDDPGMLAFQVIVAALAGTKPVQPAAAAKE